MASEKKVITLKSSDNETFEVEEAVAIQSQTIKHMVEDDCANNAIPLANVTSVMLEKVIEYCKKHVEAVATYKENNEDDKKALKVWDDKFLNNVKAYEENNEADRKALKEWDEKFMNDVKVDENILYNLLMAANYLNIKSLLDLTCQTVANMIKGKMPEEIRKTFNIKNDFTPEEEDEIRRSNQWVFE